MRDFAGMITSSIADKDCSDLLHRVLLLANHFAEDWMLGKHSDDARGTKQIYIYIYIYIYGSSCLGSRAGKTLSSYARNREQAGCCSKLPSLPSSSLIAVPALFLLSLFFSRSCSGKAPLRALD